MHQSYVFWCAPCRMATCEDCLRLCPTTGVMLLEMTMRTRMGRMTTAMMMTMTVRGMVMLARLMPMLPPLPSLLLLVVPRSHPMSPSKTWKRGLLSWGPQVWKFKACNILYHGVSCPCYMDLFGACSLVRLQLQKRKDSKSVSSASLSCWVALFGLSAVLQELSWFIHPLLHNIGTSPSELSWFIPPFLQNLGTSPSELSWFILPFFA